MSCNTSIIKQLLAIASPEFLNIYRRSCRRTAQVARQTRTRTDKAEPIPLRRWLWLEVLLPGPKAFKKIHQAENIFGVTMRCRGSSGACVGRTASRGNAAGLTTSCDSFASQSLRHSHWMPKAQLALAHHIHHNQQIGIPVSWRWGLSCAAPRKRSAIKNEDLASTPRTSMTMIPVDDRNNVASTWPLNIDVWWRHGMTLGSNAQQWSAIALFPKALPRNSFAMMAIHKNSCRLPSRVVYNQQHKNVQWQEASIVKVMQTMVSHFNQLHTVPGSVFSLA